ncbi:MAG: hypothetical protein ACYSU8_05625 [Planctomycetota bacterium]|jgi:hypothetical protein
MRKTNIAENLAIAKYIVVTLVLGCVLITSRSGWAKEGGEFVLRWSGVGAGDENTGGAYSQTGSVQQTDAKEMSGGKFTVAEDSIVTIECVVDFEAFAVFAQYWLESGTDLSADLYKDKNNIVDFYDLDAFVYEWLYYCPYDWTLK